MDTLYLYLKRYHDHAMYVTGWRGRGSRNRVSEIKLLTCSHYQGRVHGHGDRSSKFGATDQEKWLVINQAKASATNPLQQQVQIQACFNLVSAF